MARQKAKNPQKWEGFPPTVRKSERKARADARVEVKGKKPRKPRAKKKKEEEEEQGEDAEAEVVAKIQKPRKSKAKKKRQEAKKKRDREDQSPKSLTAEHAKGLISVNPATLGEGLDFFYALEPDVGFADLRAALVAYESSFDILAKSPKRLPIEALVVLAMNDFACATDAPGRMRHSRGFGDESSPIFFADRAWKEYERADFMRFPPRQRLAVSSAPELWHWTSADEPVMTIRVLDVKPYKWRGRLYDESGDVLGYDMHSVNFDVESSLGDKDATIRNRCSKVVAILWLDGRLFLTTIQEMLECSFSTRKELKMDSPPTWRYPLYRLGRAGPKEGFVSVCWRFRKSSPACQSWARSREVTGERLEEGLLERLLQMANAFTEGDDLMMQLWGTEYDRICQGE